MKTHVTIHPKLRKLGSLGRKQLLALRRYGTPKKLANALHCELEKAARRVRTRSMPYTAIIELTNACNLRCPGCPTGLGIVGRPKSALSLPHLQQFLDAYGPYLLIANLFNWGESLLHPHAPELVHAVHERNIFTCISTNLNIADTKKLEEVCEAGLDHLIVSLDGTTDASYAQYRRGGDLQLVLHNMRHIADWKKRKNKKFPVIEWQMLSFRHVEPEILDAARRATSLGADWFSVRAAVAPPPLQPEQPSLKGTFFNGRDLCPLLWDNITLQCDGGLAPCCMVYHQRDDFGHIEPGDVRLVQNNERYQAAKSLMGRRTTTLQGVPSGHPCLRCPVVHRRPQLSACFSGNDDDASAIAACEDFQSIVADTDEIRMIREQFVPPRSELSS